MTDTDLVRYTTMTVGLDTKITPWCPLFSEYESHTEIAKLCLHLEFTLDDLCAFADTFGQDAAVVKETQELFVSSPRAILRYQIATSPRK